MRKDGVLSKTKIVVIISVVIVVVSASFLWTQTNINAENKESGVLRATIIDQLQTDIPNEHFDKKATEFLKMAGYEVDLYTTENVTIDFYKKLPSMNYKFIVVRSHALAKETDDKSVMLFSGEKYTTDKYIQEQLLGQVAKGTPLLEEEFQAKVGDSAHFESGNSGVLLNVTMPAKSTQRAHDEFFLVTPKLVSELMVGKFPGSVVILGGCNTLENPSMAEPMIKRGASSVIGWNDFVGSADNDRVILDVLEKILVNKMEPQEAVNEVKNNYHLNPKYPATLEYYTG